MCRQGSCAVSICEVLALRLCQCTEEANQCLVCCMSHAHRCVPLHTIPGAAFTSPVARMPGQACNDYHGVCDDRRQCLRTGKRGARDRLSRFLTADVIRRAFSKYGLYIALSAAAFIILAFLLLTVYRRRKSSLSKSPAYNMAKVTLLWQEAQKHHEELTYKLELLRTQFKAFEEDESVFSYKVSTETEVTRTIARIRALFPRVPGALVQELVERLRSEEQVVDMLIERGHAMKKIL